MSFEFVWPVRVYYEDTDASGVVYHARYLHFFERARSEWLRAQGLDHRKLVEDEGAVFTVAGLDIRYLAPARLDDLLEVGTGLARQGGASLVFEQTLRRPGGPVLATATVRVACVDASTFRPRRLPTKWLEP